MQTFVPGGGIPETNEKRRAAAIARFAEILAELEARQAIDPASTPQVRTFRFTEAVLRHEWQLCRCPHDPWNGGRAATAGDCPPHCTFREEVERLRENTRGAR